MAYESPYKSDLVWVEGTYVHSTDGAVLVKPDIGGKGAKQAWVPKSVCDEIEVKGDRVKLKLPKSMAYEKGLL